MSQRGNEFIILLMKENEKQTNRLAGKNKYESVTLNIQDNIHDIFSYKKAYDVHIRKLSQIRSLRKQSLKINSTRNIQIQYLKDIKHQNFMYKINQEAYKICEDNLKLFDKLNHQMSVNRAKALKMPVSMKTKRSIELASSQLKLEKQKIIAKENQRLRQRIKSSKSSISNSRILEEDRKKQQIRNRIRKFNAESELKVYRYFSALQNRQVKEPTFICSLSNSKARRKSSSEAVGSTSSKHQFFNEKQKNSKLSSFYNPRDVIRNKIQNLERKNFSFRNGNQNPRPVTVEAKRTLKKTPDAHDNRRHNSFFATQ